MRCPIDFIRSATAAAERTSGNAAAARDADARLLRQAKQHLEAAKEREAAAAKLEGVLRADHAELSLRERALSEAEARASTREQTAIDVEEQLRVRLPVYQGSQQQQPMSSAPIGEEGGVGQGATSGGRGWVTGLQSLALGSSISAASPFHSTGWRPPAAGANESHGDVAASRVPTLPGGHGHGDVETRERQLEEWSQALAEQAGAMREQALRLEEAYDQLRRKEAEAKPDAMDSDEGEDGGEPRGDAAARVPTEGAARERQRRGLPHSPAVSPPPVALAEPVVAAISGGGMGDDGDDDVSRTTHVGEVGRQLEQETVRLAEKARELDAERRRLTVSAEAANREHARAQMERKEVLEARKDAATLRLELERERARLDAEKGGLAAERSLLAAERGRLVTERARTRRGDTIGAEAEVCEVSNFRATAQGSSETRTSRISRLPPAARVAVEAVPGAASVAGAFAADVGRFGAGDDGRGGEGDLAGVPTLEPPLGRSSAPTAPSGDSGGVASNAVTGEHRVDTGGADPRAGGETAENEELPTLVGHVESEATRQAGRDRTSPETTPGAPPGARPTAPASRDKEFPGSPVVLIRKLASELARESPGSQGSPAGRVVGSGRTQSGGGGASARVRGDGGNTWARVSSTASEEETVPKLTNNSGHTRNSVPHVCEGARRRGDRESAAERQGRRSARKETRSRGREDGDQRAERPSLESIRRRLQGVSRRGGGSGGGEKAETSEDNESSPPFTGLTRRKPPGRSASSSPSFSRLPHSSEGADRARQNRKDSPPPRGVPSSRTSPPLGQRVLRRAPVTPSAASRIWTAAAAREDPFLAQLHARLAGADHTLRQSLGRRQALLSRFGHDASSSLGIPSEPDTSDFPSASVDASPEATASASSSPADAAGQREGTAADAVVQRRNDQSSAVSSSGLGSSPELEAARSRFGFKGAVTPRRVVPPRERGRRRESPSAAAAAVVVGQEGSPSESTSTAGGLAAGTRGLLPNVTDDSVRVEERATGGAGEEGGNRPRLMQPRAGSRGASVSASRGGRASTAAAGRVAGRGGTAPRGTAGRTMGTAASDTDDTEAEKENLRELMRALGTDDDGDDLDMESSRQDQEGLEAQDQEGVAAAGGGGGALSRDRRWDSDDNDEDAMPDSGQAGAAPIDGGVEEVKGGEEENIAAGGVAVAGEADAGGGDTLMSSLRAQNQDIASRLQDMSLQVSPTSCASAPAG